MKKGRAESGSKVSNLVTRLASMKTVAPEKESLARRIPGVLRTAADRLVDSLKVNSVSEQVRRGRTVVIKRRNIYSEPLAELTNAYFRMAGIPIRFWSKTKDWRGWEVKWFNILNGDSFHARASASNMGLC